MNYIDFLNEINKGIEYANSIRPTEFTSKTIADFQKQIKIWCDKHFNPKAMRALIENDKDKQDIIKQRMIALLTEGSAYEDTIIERE